MLSLKHIIKLKSFRVQQGKMINYLKKKKVKGQLGIHLVKNEVT